ncbi:hypothetical protein ACHAXS_009719 [Conticribra weissflogii]
MNSMSENSVESPVLVALHAETKPPLSQSLHASTVPLHAVQHKDRKYRHRRSKVFALYHTVSAACLIVMGMITTGFSSIYEGPSSANVSLTLGSSVNEERRRNNAMEELSRDGRKSRLQDRDRSYTRVESHRREEFGRRNEMIFFSQQDMKNAKGMKRVVKMTNGIGGEEIDTNEDAKVGRGGKPNSTGVRQDKEQHGRRDSEKVSLSFQIDSGHATNKVMNRRRDSRWGNPYESEPSEDDPGWSGSKKPSPSAPSWGGSKKPSASAPSWGSSDKPGWGSSSKSYKNNYSKSSKSGWSKSGKSYGDKSGKGHKMTPHPTSLPTTIPTIEVGTFLPTASYPPTTAPIEVPSAIPTANPSVTPSSHPSISPSDHPSFDPSDFPSLLPSTMPSDLPSATPSHIPSNFPSEIPSNHPSSLSSFIPSESNAPSPTSQTRRPTISPTSSSAPSPVGATRSPTPAPFEETQPPTKEGITKAPSPPAMTQQPTVANTETPTLEGATKAPSPTVKSPEPTVTETEPPTLPEGTKAPSPPGVTSEPTIPATTMAPIAPTETIMPTESATTGAPTSSSPPTPFGQTKPPTVSPTTSPPTTAGTNAPTNGATTVTNAPTTSPMRSASETPTAGPTEQPTPAPNEPTQSPTTATQAPTNVLTTDSRSDLMMQVFGIDIMNPDQRNVFQDDMARYMEDFYNTDTDFGSILEAAKSAIYDVSATIVIYEQIPAGTARSDRLFKPLSALEKGVEKKKNNPKTFETLEERVDAKAAKGKPRMLQKGGDGGSVVAGRSETDVTEPCEGEPVTIFFSIIMNYRTSSPNLVGSDVVLAFPFRSTQFREIFIDDYLKAPKNNGIFDDVYCTSRMMFPGGSTYSPTTAVTSAEPTSSVTSMSPSIEIGSVVPTIANLSLVPTLINISMAPTITNSSIVPTTANLSLIPTISNGSLVPTVANKSMAPTIANESMVPTIMIASMIPTTSNESMVPTIMNASMTPTVSNKSMVPTIMNVSMTPTITENSVVPTIRDISMVPTTTNGSLVPTVDNGSMVPTAAIESMVPTIANGSMVPTTANGSTVPTIANGSMLPTLNNGSFVPTVANGSMVPTAGNVSLVPTMANGSMVPTAGNASLVPTMANGSMVPTIGNASFVPTVANRSMIPTITNASMVPTTPSIATSVPTLVNRSLVPTISNGSLAPTANGTTISTTGTRSNVNMRLYGLNQLEGADANWYNTRTANYIEFFYNSVEECTSNNEGIRCQVIDVNANVALTDQIPPAEVKRISPVTKSTASDYFNEKHNAMDFLPSMKRFKFGQNDRIPSSEGKRRSLQDCSGPFLSAITNMTVDFRATNLSVTIDQILAEPFSTEEYRNIYLNLLTTNGQLPDLTCTSEIEIPNEPPSPTTTSQPSPMSVIGTIVPTLSSSSNETNGTKIFPTASPPPSVPSGMVDDIFIDDASVRRSGTLYERSCDGSFSSLQEGIFTEFEVAFAFGVEVTTSSYDYIDDLEIVVLDFVSASVLQCIGDTEKSLQLLRREDTIPSHGVVRVRYPPLGKISSIAHCEPTLPSAQGCAVLTLKLLITFIDMPESEVHNDILNLLADATEKDIFEEFVPEVITLNYLGPDPEVELVLSESVGSSNENSSTVGLVFGVTFCAAMVLTMMLFAFPLSRDEMINKLQVLFCRQRRVSRSNPSLDEVAALDTSCQSKGFSPREDACGSHT